MNLGLALVKPGESRNAEARRLWLSNMAAWNLTPYTIEKHIDAQKLTDIRLRRLVNNENYTGFKLAREAVKKTGVLNQVALPLPRFVTNELQLRNCRECAHIGYHCSYFDTPWLSHCPVHQETLTTQCTKCGAPWQNEFKVQLSRCDECGVRISQQTLMDRGAFDRSAYDQEMTKLVNFFNTETSLAISDSKYIGTNCTRRFDTYSKVLSYPSLLAKKLGLNSFDLADLRQMISPIFPMLKVQFELSNESFSFEVSEGERLMMKQVREKLYRRTLRLLCRHAKHELGSCPRDTNFGEYKCFYCQMWFSMKRGFYKRAPTHFCSELLCYDPPRQRCVRVSNPGLVFRIFDKNTSRYYSLPPRITELLYSVDVWMAIKIMAFKIDFHYSKKDKLNISRLDYDPSYRQLFTPYSQHLASFYFDIEDGVCSLYIPRPLISSQLRDYSDLIALTKEF